MFVRQVAVRAVKAIGMSYCSVDIIDVKDEVFGLTRRHMTRQSIGKVFGLEQSGGVGVGFSDGRCAQMGRFSSPCFAALGPSGSSIPLVPDLRTCEGLLIMEVNGGVMMDSLPGAHGVVG